MVKDAWLLYPINTYTLAFNFHCASLVSISNYYILRKMYHKVSACIYFTFGILCLTRDADKNK